MWWVMLVRQSLRNDRKQEAPDINTTLIVFVYVYLLSVIVKWSW